MGFRPRPRPRLGLQADDCSGRRPAGCCRLAESRGLDRPVVPVLVDPFPPLAGLAHSLSLLLRPTCLAGSPVLKDPVAVPGHPAGPAAGLALPLLQARLSVRLLLAIAPASPADPEARAGPSAPPVPAHPVDPRLDGPRHPDSPRRPARARG